MSGENGSTKFIYMGDPQCSRIIGRDNDYSQWGVLLGRAVMLSGEHKPLLVLGGDLINRSESDGAWDAFFHTVDDAAKDIPMATVVNGSEESAGIYADRFTNPGNGPVGYEKEFFSFDYGCCHFLFLNSDYMGNRSADAVAFISNWIRADLAANRKPVVFAVAHHPFYTVGTAFDDDVRATGMRENYLELLQEAGVDFILCGHQHVYTRTEEAEDGSGVTQIMGVSGTKYFDAHCKSNMEAVREYVSVATVFETDGETIRLRTIDKEGVILDEYVQQVRMPSVVFSAASGADRYEVTEADPLKPANKEGISVSVGGITTFFNDTQLAQFESIEMEYSVMRRNRLRHETYRGFRLIELLSRALPTQLKTENCVAILTDSRGRQKGMPLGQVMTAWRYTSSAGGERDSVPPLIIKENGMYRLIIGQQTPEQYNGRDWIRDIRNIDVVAPTFYTV